MRGLPPSTRYPILSLSLSLLAARWNGKGCHSAVFLLCRGKQRNHPAPQRGSIKHAPSLRGVKPGRACLVLWPHQVVLFSHASGESTAGGWPERVTPLVPWESVPPFVLSAPVSHSPKQAEHSPGSAAVPGVAESAAPD